ncbi:hypothetical protein JCM11957_10080 [Caminibacter profundus]
MLDKFFKKQFVSFYKDNNYKLILEIVKNKKVLQSTEKEFNEKEELEKFIKETIDENPQTYTSTMLLTLNQGVMDSCSKQKYLEKDIDYDNIKILCIDNKYSFYASIYDLSSIKKEFLLPIDFIYSVFAIIDSIATYKKNRFYILTMHKYIAILGYENNKPIYSDLIELNEEEEKQEEIEDIDILDDIEDLSEDIEELSEDIEETSVDIEEIDENLKESELTTDIEVNILNSIKESLKDYYDNYSSDFIEKIIILDTVGIDIQITNLIEDELFISTEIQQIDLLKSINRLSIESI